METFNTSTDIYTRLMGSKDIVTVTEMESAKHISPVTHSNDIYEMSFTDMIEYDELNEDDILYDVGFVDRYFELKMAYEASKDGEMVDILKHNLKHAIRKLYKLGYKQEEIASILMTSPEKVKGIVQSSPSWLPDHFFELSLGDIKLIKGLCKAYKEDDTKGYRKLVAEKFEVPETIVQRLESGDLAKNIK